MQAASGNSSDKTAFSEIISEHLKSFQEATKSLFRESSTTLICGEESRDKLILKANQMAYLEFKKLRESEVSAEGEL